ncbi:hypothetical protein RND81_01G155200 [Saponaria officinalis]|uniref:Cytochrome P450 n=1 Tax=Saponaria officinalis TaxID=3572 RepID=A0AAW1N7S0_SAPOF
MEFQFLKQLSVYTASIVALLLFVYCLLKWKWSDSSMKHPPEPSGSWPIIGHLRLLGALPHISLGKMADKHGPIFMIKLGVQRVLVVSSHTMAKECLGVNDRVFVDRPKTIFVERLTYNSVMFGFGPYGSYWRDIRKVSIVELLSNHKVEKFKHVRISELQSSIKDIHDSYCVSKKKAVDMKQWFNDVSLNSIVRLVAGKSLKEFYQGEKYDKMSKALRDFFELAGVIAPADALPFLRCFDFGGYEKTMKKVAQEIDQVLQEWLEEHKKRMNSGNGNEKRDFMDVLLGLYETDQNKPTKYGADTVIKATCVTMIVAATDTTTVTLTWALSLLLNNRETINKAQAEIDAIVGKERQVKDSDLKDLPYLDAIVKETLRLYPAEPLSLTRVAVEDCTVNGYDIAAGTQLFVNIYKIHRDPEVWQNPLEFHPERFLTTHKDYEFRGTNFAFIPFGSGRRMCPGITLAYKSMMLTLASLLHGFEISTPSNETVDMTESFGLTNLKTTPLDVILVPRLADNLYNPPAVNTV